MNTLDYQKDYLLSKLYDYLVKKNINPDNNFNCLNPNHQDANSSMFFNFADNTVECPICHAKYNIFDLIGIDFNLSTYPEIFNKAVSLYLPNYAPSNAPNLNDSFAPELKIVSPKVTSNQESLQNNNFVIKLQQDTNINKFNVDPFASEPERKSNNNAFKDEHLENNNIFHNFNNTSQSNSINPFNLNLQSTGTATRQQIINETINVVEQYLDKCHANVANTNYFINHGISAEVINRFKLGFDNHYQRGTNAYDGSTNTWEAIIIPYSKDSFYVGNTNEEDFDKCRRKGDWQIFNINALDDINNPTFIVKNELDALSLETLGFNAISIGTDLNIQKLINVLETKDLSQNTIYLNFDRTIENNPDFSLLLSILKEKAKSAQRIDIAFPWENINDALIQARNTLYDRLLNLDKLLNLNIHEVNSTYAGVKLIESTENLFNLDLSNGLYSLIGNTILLRSTISELARTIKTNCYYVGTEIQWELLCSCIKIYNNEKSFIKLLEINNIAQDLENALLSLHLKCEYKAKLIIDLTLYTKEECRNIMMFLHSLFKKYNTTILILGSQDNIDIISNYCIQTIETHLVNDKEQIFKSLNNYGLLLSFSRYLRL